MTPESLRLSMVILATAATIIASQAVITGAYSLAQQGIALGLFPRISIHQADERGSCRADLYPRDQLVAARRG